MEQSRNITIFNILGTFFSEYFSDFHWGFFPNILGISQGNVPQIFLEHIFARWVVTSISDQYKTPLGLKLRRHYKVFATSLCPLGRMPISLSSFFPRAARLWNSLHVECFPLSHDLNGFKSRHNRHFSPVRSFETTLLYALIF